MANRSSHPSPAPGGGKAKPVFSEPLSTDQPLPARGSQIFTLTLWEAEGAEMLLSAVCGFVN